MRPTLLTLVSIISLLSLSRAQAAERRDLQAKRTSEPIVVDGRLDESAWSSAPIATDFIQSDPDTGAAATERTEVRVVYDSTTLYIGVFAAHHRVDDIVVNELKRDFDGSASDWFAVILDPFLDRRNGYQFGVNPAGAAWDSQKFNEGRERNLSWDGVWMVRTSLSAQGWYAEFAIPFKTFQLPSTPRQTWGVNFERHLQRRLENSFWSPLPRLGNIDRLSLAGTLSGLDGLSSGANLRVKPYASVRHDTRGVGSSTALVSGLDIKYGLTSGLTADLTINTDFSQVEADVQQVGVSRFSVLFPEKREFFLENSGVFQFGPAADRATQISAAPGTSAGGRDNSVQNEVALFFSRRIGLTSSGDQASIRAGGRLSGQLAGVTVGALLIQQSADSGEPEALFTVLRARRNLFAGADAGVMFVTRESALAPSRVLGADVNLRPLRDLAISGYIARSLDLSSAVRDGERSAGRAGIVWRDGVWSVEGSIGMLGRSFDDGAGFVPRAGVLKRQALLGRYFRPAILARWVREVYPAIGYTDIRREAGGFDSRYWEQRLLVTFENGATAEIGANPNEEDLTEPFVISRVRGFMVPTGRYAFTDRFARFTTSRARSFVLDARHSSGRYYDGDRRLSQVSISGRANVHLSGSLGLSHDDVAPAAGRLTTRQVTARLNYGFSTRLFFNGLVQYTSATRQVNTNLRFNFIHHPLSDVFVVFSDQRTEGLAPLHGRSVVLKITHLVTF